MEEYKKKEPWVTSFDKEEVGYYLALIAEYVHVFMDKDKVTLRQYENAQKIYHCARKAWDLMPEEIPFKTENKRIIHCLICGCIDTTVYCKHCKKTEVW